MGFSMPFGGTPTFGSPSSFHHPHNHTLEGIGFAGWLRRLLRLVAVALPIVLVFVAYDIADDRGRARLNGIVQASTPVLLRSESELTERYRAVLLREETAAELGRRIAYLEGKIAGQNRDVAQAGNTLGSLRRDVARLEAEVTGLEARLATLEAERARLEERSGRALAESAELERTRRSLQATLEDRTAMLEEARSEHSAELELVRYRR